MDDFLNWMGEPVIEQMSPIVLLLIVLGSHLVLRKLTN